MKIETSEARYQRYVKAKQEYILVKPRIDQAYRMFAPEKTQESFTDQSLATDRGNELSNNYIDSIAQDSLKKYASNLQYSLIPPMRRWTTLRPSPYAINKYGKESAEIDNFKKELEDISQSLFHVLTDSNLQQAINEAFLDMGISTGVIFNNEMSSEFHSITYRAIPPYRVYFEEDLNAVKLQNFWVDRVVKKGDIKHIWKDAKLTRRIEAISDNTIEVKLIEGCIYYPDAPKKAPYLYYVQDEENRQDLLTRWLPYSPYTGFRAFKRSGEIWGRGVADTMLPYARLLSMMNSLGVEIIKFHAFPPVAIVNAGPSFNPNTIQLTSGAVINVPSLNAIQVLNVAGDPNVLFLERQKIEATIKEAFYTNPIGEVSDTKDRTATEMQLRQEAWLRSNAVSVGRIYKEAVEPIIQKTLMSMRDKGMINNPLLGEEEVNIGEHNRLYRIELESPMVGIQGKDDALAMDGFMQRIMQMYGPNALALIQNQNLPSYYAEKLGVPLDMLQDKDTIQGIIDHVTQTLDKNKDELAKQKLEEQAQQQPSQQQTNSNMNSVLNTLKDLS